MIARFSMAGGLSTSMRKGDLGFIGRLKPAEMLGIGRFSRFWKEILDLPIGVCRKDFTCGTYPLLPSVLPFSIHYQCKSIYYYLPFSIREAFQWKAKHSTLTLGRGWGDLSTRQGKNRRQPRKKRARYSQESFSNSVSMELAR